MPHTAREVVRRRRNILVSALALALTAGAALVPASLLGGSASAAAPAKVSIKITSAYSTSLTQATAPPPAGAVGRSYVVKGEYFTVTFETSAVLSATRSTPMVLTATSGKTDLGTLATGVLDAGKTIGTISLARIADAANGVILKVDVDPSKNTVSPGTMTVDVLKTSRFVKQSEVPSLIGFGGGGGPGVPCSPTPEDQVCGDLVMGSRTALSDLAVSQGCADTCGTTDAASFLQALVALNDVPLDPTYARNNPITLIAKCDKTKCTGKGVKFYKFAVQLTPVAGSGATDWTDSPPCTAKGIVNQDGDFCTDYVQSSRDGAGDLLLYVLFAKDLKGIFR